MYDVRRYGRAKRTATLLAVLISVTLVATACEDGVPIERVEADDELTPAPSAEAASGQPAGEPQGAPPVGEAGTGDETATAAPPEHSEHDHGDGAPPADQGGVDAAPADGEVSGDSVSGERVGPPELRRDDRRNPGRDGRRRPGGRRPPRPGPPTTAPDPGPAPTDPPTPTPAPGPPPNPSADADRVITAADQASLRNGFTVPAGQIWEFDASQSVSIDVSQNVVVNGILRMRPANGSIVHRLRFVDVDETKFVGSGMSILDSDVGLWVFGDGQLDLHGQQRTGWSRLARGAQRGASELRLDSTPVGWSVGDEITVAPTSAPGTDGHRAFDDRTIASIDGNVVRLNEPLSYDHPTVNGQWNAEVLNLTRNVQIEGTGNNTADPAANGRAHILIHSARPQSIKYVQLRHLGPREGTRRGSDGVTGRYSLHFHHSGDGSRGSIVEGVVVRNSGNSAYVTHASNGITVRDSVAYDGWENAVWWDPPEPPNSPARNRDFRHDSADILLDRMVVAGLRAGGSDGYRMAGFSLATGTNLTLTNSVAIAVDGRIQTSGFSWPDQTNFNNAWTFDNNIAHNNTQYGVFAWQNLNNRHVINDYSAYHNGQAGISQGAYVTTFQWHDTQLFSNGEHAVEQHSGSHGRGDTQRSDGYATAYENLTTNGPLIVKKQGVPTSRPVLFRNCSFTYVEIDNAINGGNPAILDFVDCGLQPDDFRMTAVAPGTVIRVQNGADAFTVAANGRSSSIAPFYPGG